MNYCSVNSEIICSVKRHQIHSTLGSRLSTFQLLSTFNNAVGWLANVFVDGDASYFVGNDMS